MNKQARCKYLEITTTAGCINRCVFCPQHLFYTRFHQKNRSNLLGWNVFKRCIDKVPKNVRIGFSGFSEPFQNPMCMRMIQYAKNRGHDISIFTTFVNLTSPDADILLHQLSLQKGGSDKITVHLPSQEPIEHIDITPEYLCVLEKMLQPGLNISFHYHGKTVNSRLKDILSETTVDHVPIHTRAGLNPLYKKTNINRKRGIISCPTHFESNILLLNGDVSVCCQDFGMKHIVGNLLRQSYRSLSNSPEMMRIKAGMMDENVDILCRYCDWAINENAVAQYYNEPFSYRKAILLSKVFVYNTSPGFFRFLRLIKHFGRHMDDHKTDQYLKWTTKLNQKPINKPFSLKQNSSSV